MNLSVGIIGLPNVGKSTLFNALLRKQQAFVANYPFATIEPNVGIVPVPDERLLKLQAIVCSYTPRVQPPIVPAIVKFTDIAGLVKGASEGAGLGNKFLSHIREVSIITHVVRAFVDENIVKEGSVDPKTDYATINTELILADIESLQKSKIMNAKKREAIEKIINSLNKGIPVRNMDLSGEEKELLRDFFLLSAKPEIIVLNVSEKDYGSENSEILRKYSEILGISEDQIVVVSAKIESDLSELSDEEQKQYLSDLGVKESGLERLIKKAYETLGLVSFLTCGEKEVRAWTIRGGTTALMASGTIHTDFEKKFIKAEVISYDDFVQNNGWKGSREVGKARLEGRNYCMQDGDVVEFKIGA